ncbi:MAG: FAD-dependent oxidoreductase [Verrucomicrobia bacterium]|jgi:glycine/D-amino acid oxidase-like deaminating enzyme|nr:FAD-dependent oxidoreductase [Verrucomicrobiota bacterium]
MPADPEKQHLIVGAGLAGCLLAWRLHGVGARVRLIGSASRPSAFRVAAGVINPVTGRWMTKSWNFDSLLPVAETTYRETETALGIGVYHPIPGIRFCQNADDVKRLGRRLRNPRYANVLGNRLPPGEASPLFRDAHGAFEIESAAYVDLPELVDALRRFFKREGLYDDVTFRYDALGNRDGLWHYQGIDAATVIFCEGAAVVENPWFDWVGLHPAKGETLLCESSSLQLPHTLFHHKKWLLPYPDGRFRIGATYDEADLSWEPTEASRAALLGDAQAALVAPHRIDVIHHLAGIRPGTADSRPILGPHPHLAGLYLLNGLGSKGAMTAPAMVRELSEHLLAQKKIDAEVDLRRFV